MKFDNKECPRCNSKNIGIISYYFLASLSGVRMKCNDCNLFYTVDDDTGHLRFEV